MGYFKFKNNETALNDDNLLAMQKAIAELLLPIGSPYITQEDINPSTILGFGTWERSKGKVFVGLDEDDANFNAIGKTGGEKTHKLTVQEMPSHNHRTVISGTNVGNARPYLATGGDFWNMGIGIDGPYTFEIITEGGNQPHNNLQPYEVVGYMWIRRA